MSWFVPVSHFSWHSKVLEICFCKNLVKLTRSAVRINGTKPKGKKNDERKNQLKVVKPELEPAPQLSPVKKVSSLEVSFSAIHTV